MNYRIEPVDKQKHLSDALALRYEVFVKEQEVPLSLEVDEWEETAVHFLAWEQERPVGTARLRWINDGIGKVERVAVLSSHRGTGLGRALMEAIEQYAIAQGASQLKLHAQTRVLDFYRKLGYSSQGEPFFDAGIEHMEMKKPILSP
ncbi:MAG: GNAT family N-acetyltransferase [Firmicutes bacterium]|nr:GNAT family N-acetyltransferase [Bacillota bacterium]